MGIAEVERLQRAYGDAVTRRAWGEVAAMFEPTCPVRLDLHSGEPVEHVGGEAIAGFIASSIERFELFLFALVNHVVDGHDDRAGTASGRVYINEIRQERSTGRWTTAYGLYQDRYRRDDAGDGSWRFAERRYSSLARTAPVGDGMLVFPFPSPA